MTLGFVFWLVMILWLLLALYVRFAPPAAPSITWPWLFDPIIYILLLLLGVGVYGWPIKT